jgi:hypothetical protein
MAKAMLIASALLAAVLIYLGLPRIVATFSSSSPSSVSIAFVGSIQVIIPLEILTVFALLLSLILYRNMKNAGKNGKVFYYAYFAMSVTSIITVVSTYIFVDSNYLIDNGVGLLTKAGITGSSQLLFPGTLILMLNYVVLALFVVMTAIFYVVKVTSKSTT